MGTTLTGDVKVKPGGLGVGGKGGSDDGGGPKKSGPQSPEDWPPGWSREDAIEPAKYRIGMWIAMASILMLFVSLTSAYIVRQTQGLSDDAADWIIIQMPSALWLNTAVIVASSFSIELARRALQRNEYSRFNLWLVITTALGVSFLVGQIVAWRHLAHQGIYLSSNPHSSFFYLLTSLHGVHLLGGVIALIFLTVTTLRLRIGMRTRAVVGATTLYWHFMDILWIYLFLLLFFWR